MAISGQRPSSELAQRLSTGLLDLLSVGQASATRCKRCPSWRQAGHSASWLRPPSQQTRSDARQPGTGTAQWTGYAWCVGHPSGEQHMCSPCPWPGCRVLPGMGFASASSSLPEGCVAVPISDCKAEGKTLCAEAIHREPVMRLQESSAMREASCLLKQECELLLIPD